jgi:hypothetical protein
VTSAARSEASQTLGRATSDAVGRINAAETARTLMVEGINSEAVRFQKLLSAYQGNPDLFVQQRLVETMGRVFASAQDKLFLPTTADGKPVELRLLLSREPPKPKQEEAKP